ncbi:nucleopolyhedrovirus P10 family protein [Streptomyces sp. NBC_01506]|uniref:nucleopolyhedrovirus P10 family protein n=1 Tax=Streptomyces sp. NBC_01506 TaxID=2903887 RepID=UPI0038671A1E
MTTGHGANSANGANGGNGAAGTDRADGWSTAVRERLGLGRLLPLGDPADGVWLAERAATTALRRTAAEVPGATLGRLRLCLADPGSAEVPAVKPPPGALPPGVLRIDGDFAALAGEPLPDVAERLRTALYTHAVDGLGLRVTEVDLRVTALLEEPPEEPDTDSSGATAPVGAVAVAPKGTAAVIAAKVPGVAHLSGSLGTAVLVTRGHVRVELATAAGHRPWEVARGVSRAVSASLPSHPTVAVLITSVDVR